MADADDQIINANEEVLEQPSDEVIQDQVDQEVEEQPVEVEEEEAPEERPISRREQLRIRDILSKREEPDTSSKQRQNVPDALQYEDELDADKEVIERLKTDRSTYGEQMFNQGLEQAKTIQFHTRLEIDAPRVESKHPELDKSSEDFHPVLANAINQMYLSAVGYDAETKTVQNSSIRYADYVESVWELAEEIAGRKVEATAKNIKQQAATTGLRPDGSRPKSLNLNKAPQDMTDEELNAAISLGIPPKK